MKWMEVIKLQTPGLRRDAMRRFLAEELAKLPACDGLVSIRLLQDVNVENELSLLLDWTVEPVSRNGSEVAQHLLRVLAEHGLCHHATWLDVTKG